MKKQVIDTPVLGAWLLAAMVGPVAQFLGSECWLTALVTAAAAALLWTGVLALPAPRFGRILTVLEIGWLVVALAGAAKSCVLCWEDRRGSLVICGVLLALAARGAVQGARRCGSAAAVLFWCLVGLMGVIGVFALPEIRLEWLNPVWGEPGAMAAAVLLLPGVAAFFPREKGKPPVAWAGAIAALTGAVAMLTQGGISQEVAGRMPGAFFAMVQNIRIAGVAERLEAVVAAAMTLGWYCLINLLLTAICHLAEPWVGKGSKAVVWLCALLALLTKELVWMVPQWLAVLGNLTAWVILPAISSGFQKNVEKFENKA